MLQGTRALEGEFMHKLNISEDAMPRYMPVAASQSQRDAFTR